MIEKPGDHTPTESLAYQTKDGADVVIPMFEPTLQATGSNPGDGSEFGSLQKEYDCPDCEGKGVFSDKIKNCVCSPNGVKGFPPPQFPPNFDSMSDEEVDNFFKSIPQPTPQLIAEVNARVRCKLCLGCGFESTPCAKCGGDGFSEKGRNDPSSNHAYFKNQIEKLGFPTALVPVYGDGVQDRWTNAEKWIYNAIKMKDAQWRFVEASESQMLSDLGVRFFGFERISSDEVKYYHDIVTPKSNQDKKEHSFYVSVLCIYCRMKKNGSDNFSDPEYFKDHQVEHQIEAVKILSEIVSRIKNPIKNVGI